MSFELPKLLVTGALGQIGYELSSLATEQGFDVVTCSHAELDISDSNAVAKAMSEHRPAYVINAAGYTTNLLTQPERDFAINRIGPGILAAACLEHDAALVQLSCASVFDGKSDRPYTETDIVAPVSPQGRSIHDGEQQVRSLLKRHLILRTGWVFSSRGDCVVKQLLDEARSNTRLEIADGLMGSPTWASDLSRVVMAVIKQLDCGIENWGTYHYCASESVNWFNFCEAVIAATRQFEDLPLEELKLVSQDKLFEVSFPDYSVLDCSKILRDFGVHQRAWRAGLINVARTLHSHPE